MRRCTVCLKLKNDEEFSWDIRAIGKRKSQCKSCINRQNQIYYRTHMDTSRRTQARRFVFDYLSRHVCEVCGEYRPEALQFDHVYGEKKMNISQMVNMGYSIEAIEQEISKCRVICANCHQMAERRKRGG